MLSLDDIDYLAPDFVDYYDELPLWSAFFGRMLLQYVPLLSHGTYVDAGAGTGFLSLELAQRCGASATVIAVDPWSAAIDRLRTKAEYLRLSNIVTHVCPIEQAPISDRSVDVIVSNLGVNNFEQPMEALRKCHRMCRSGGRILLTTNLVGHMAEFYEVFRQVLQDTNQANRLPILQEHIAHRSSIESLSSQLDAIGFQVTGVLTDSFQERYANGSALLRHFFIRLGFLSGWKKVVEPNQMQATFVALEQKLNDQAKRSGELSLTIPVALAVAIKTI